MHKANRVASALEALSQSMPLPHSTDTDAKYSEKFQVSASEL